MRTTRDGRNGNRASLTYACILVLAIVSMRLAVPRPTLAAVSDLPRFIDEYPVPTANSAPLALTVDRNGIVWFTESNATKLGRFDPETNTFKEYAVPGVGDMWGIATDPGGNIWLTQYSLKGSVNPGGAIEPGGNGRLIRFNPTNGSFTMINVPTAGSFPFRVVTDEEGRVWFTELLGNDIGSYDPSSGELREYPVPTQYAGPADLTFDNHGRLWFTEAYNESVATFDVQTHQFVEYHFSSIDPTQYVGSPVGISVTQDGIVWVADHGGNWIVEFNSTSQQVTRYPTHIPPPQVYPISIPNGLLVDSKGRVWFCEHGGNSVGFFDPSSKTMVEFPIPTGPISTALWIALAPDGNVWFTEWSADKIGVVHADRLVPFTVSASSDHLDIPAGGHADLSLLTNNLQGTMGNATYLYSWPSYNQGDVNVTFTPQNTSLLAANTASQARITVSSNTEPGEYIMGLGVSTDIVRVWAMIHVDIGAPSSISNLITQNAGLLIAGITVVTGVVFLVQRRARKRNLSPRRG